MYNEPSRLEGDAGHSWRALPFDRENGVAASPTDGNERSEQILDAISAVLVGVQPDWTVSVWNRGAEEASGVPRSEAIGQRVESVPSVCLQQPALRDALARCLADGSHQHLHRVPYDTPGDEQRFLEVHVSAVIDADGQRIGALLGATDITQRLVMEQQLTQAQRLESIGQLASGIAHEINTPTQFVGDNVRFLRDELPHLVSLCGLLVKFIADDGGTVDSEFIGEVKAAVSESDLEYLRQEIPVAIDQTLEGVERIATIVRAMKDFSHPGSSERELADLNQALESTATVARSEWKYVAELKFNLAVDLPLVPCFIGDLKQVFLNLIVNAAQAISELPDAHGSGLITVSTETSGNWVEIRVADTGVGVPESIHHRIFDPFFTTKGIGKGTGQGLAIARSIVVDKHGGQLLAESQPGCGSTFIVRLPISDAAAA